MSDHLFCPDFNILLSVSVMRCYKNFFSYTNKEMTSSVCHLKHFSLACSTCRAVMPFCLLCLYFHPVAEWNMKNFHWEITAFLFFQLIAVFFFLYYLLLSQRPYSRTSEQWSTSTCISSYNGNAFWDDWSKFHSVLNMMHPDQHHCTLKIKPAVSPGKSWNHLFQNSPG